MVRNPCQQTRLRMKKTAEGMMPNFAERGHPVFRASSAFEKRRIEKAKGKE